jgi:drug/metabolite transporter (DMT)-like permease
MPVVGNSGVVCCIIYIVGQIPYPHRANPKQGFLPMRFSAYAFLTATALLWAGNTIAGKLAVGHISPAALTQLRWVIAFSIMLAVASPHLKKDWPVIRKHLPYLIFMGTVGYTVFNNLFYIAFKYTTALNVGIEQASMPLFIFLLNFLIVGMRVTRSQAIGFSLTLIGVAVVVSHGQLSRLIHFDVGLGDGLLMIAVVSYALFTLSLRWKPPMHWSSFMMMLAAVALAGTLPFTLREYASGTLFVPDLQGWLVLLYAALGPSLLAQLFFIRGNELIGSNRAGVFVNLVPVFATVLAILILDEQLMIYHIVGLVLVLGGIGFAERSQRATRQVR